MYKRQVLHFGLGTIEKIDSLVITWPDRTQTIYQNLALNQRHVFEYKNTQRQPIITTKDSQALFHQLENALTANAHTFTKFYDFNVQPQIQKISSEEGPAVVIADLNNDGLDDCIMDVG